MAERNGRNWWTRPWLVTPIDPIKLEQCLIRWSVWPRLRCILKSPSLSSSPLKGLNQKGKQIRDIGGDNESCSIGFLLVQEKTSDKWVLSSQSLYKKGQKIIKSTRNHFWLDHCTTCPTCLRNMSCRIILALTFRS